MANKYLKQFPVPDSFPNVLRDLTREILRLQPRDIVGFSAHYFKCLENGQDFVWDDPNPRAPRPCDYPKVKSQSGIQKPLKPKEAAPKTAPKSISHITEEKLKEYRKAFQTFDKDNSGGISKDEMREVMNSLGVNPSNEELEGMIKEVDLDENGLIGFEEFADLMHRKEKQDKEQQNQLNDEVLDAFKTFDRDGSGLITRAELLHVMEILGSPLTQEEVNEMIQEADMDKDGCINYEEFVRMMTADPEENKEPTQTEQEPTGTQEPQETGEPPQTEEAKQEPQTQQETLDQPSEFQAEAKQEPAEAQKETPDQPSEVQAEVPQTEEVKQETTETPDQPSQTEEASQEPPQEPEAQKEAPRIQETKQEVSEQPSEVKAESPKETPQAEETQQEAQAEA